MARVKPRPRRRISARHVWMVKALGFRYSASRDAYVLHVVGNHIGPVLRPIRDDYSSSTTS